ncbi:TonB-dependent receptor plug domain-containing protein [Yoonia sp. I 8.24]|uniref:TonB-dependent receptor plug domain-containing protein n=1 Tax=Yoonia sp. I 8.24 TaxID=1537229 RepID=UPI001EDF5776|nr:TonB-dependent receptor plug domain-containing protein [Yoonia sp. I 8.24]MCG3268322.1 TonB-dependent receptor [Yoonia sp. I 8.24]
MKNLRLTTCILLGMGPASLSAQDTAATDNASDAPFMLGRILLSTALNPEAEDGVSVTSEGLALANPADLSELFVAEPTLAVGSSIPMSQKLYVNGIEENNLAISIDGARQNNRVFHHNTTTLIDPSLLQAVSIDPGVAPADAGPGALAGALDYETRDVSDLLDTGDNFGGAYKLEYASNGDILTNSLTLLGREGGLEVLAFARYATGDNRVDGNGDEIVGSSTELLSLLGKVAYESEEGHRFEFSMEDIGDDAARPYRANIGAIVGDTRPETRTYDLTRTNYSIEYTNTRATGLWDPYVRLSYSGTELINDEYDLSTEQYAYGETTSVNGEISNKFALANGDVNVGVDFFSDEASYEFLYALYPSYDDAGQEELVNVGLFAQLRLEPTDRTRLSTGFRADFQDFTGIDGSTQSTEGLSFNASGEVDLNDRLTIGAGYSQVWGGIALAENYIMNSAWDYSTDDIEDVTSENLYVAATYATDRWAIDGKVFSTDIDDSRAATWGGGPALTADVSSTGYEIGFSTNWDSGFFRIGYANIETEVNDEAADSYTGNYLTIPMGEIISLQTAHEFANGVVFGGDAEIALDYSGAASGVTIAGYTVVNTFVEYEPERIEGLSLRAEINNLFDEQYVARATYGQDFDTVEPLYETGQSLRLSAELTF